MDTNKDEHTIALIKRVAKKNNLIVLFALKTGAKKWSDLEKIMNKRLIHESLKELAKLKLIETTILYNTPLGSKAYKLTPLGERIVKLLEQIGKEFSENSTDDLKI